MTVAIVSVAVVWGVVFAIVKAGVYFLTEVLR
jgi:hypothetical protein